MRDRPASKNAILIVEFVSSSGAAAGRRSTVVEAARPVAADPDDLDRLPARRGAADARPRAGAAARNPLGTVVFGGMLV
jgi:multidrug efflux pump subunit AcrB